MLDRSNGAKPAPCEHEVALLPTLESQTGSKSGRYVEIGPVQDKNTFVNEDTTGQQWKL